jgi:hypothetical protein
VEGDSGELILGAALAFVYRNSHKLQKKIPGRYYNVERFGDEQGLLPSRMPYSVTTRFRDRKEHSM